MWKSFFTICLLFLTGVLVSINWFTWLYSISVNNMLDASLGYYIFPILSVFLGKIFLKEKINRNKAIAILLVFLSIIYLLIEFKNIPWIGLTVAITFSLYTLIRKKINISSDIGLFFETLLISPIALILFGSLVFDGTNIFGFVNPTLSFYLFFSGFMTLVPLFMYIKGFELIGIGPASMIFFLTPTAQFFLSIFYLGQPLEMEKLISFLFIWIAVIIYLNELRKEWDRIITKGATRDTKKEIKSKFVLIKNEKFSIDIKFPTRMLLWKFWLGKNSNPKIKPQIIEYAASLGLIFLLKKP